MKEHAIITTIIFIESEIIRMNIIAKVHTDFKTKFGLPRQSGLIPELKGRIIFEPEYRQPEAFRGLEGFSHIWILWKFSESKKEHWAATVTPPRLGGKKRVGVFATRSPFRPNDIGMSCVKLESIEYDSKSGPILHVAGIDMMDQTPVYDIKPYIPYADCHPEAKEGFVTQTKDYALDVIFPLDLLEIIPKEKQNAIMEVLKQDPRPAYDADSNRRYGVDFAGFDVRFYVRDGVLSVCEIEILSTGEVVSSAQCQT